MKTLERALPFSIIEIVFCLKESIGGGILFLISLVEYHFDRVESVTSHLESSF